MLKILVALFGLSLSTFPANSFEVDGWKSGQHIDEVRRIHSSSGQRLEALGDDGRKPFPMATYLSDLGFFHFCQDHLVMVTANVPTWQEYLRLLHRRILISGSVPARALTHPTPNGSILTVSQTWILGRETYTLGQSVSTGTLTTNSSSQTWSLASVCDTPP